MKAKEMFEKLGFKITINTENYLQFTKFDYMEDDFIICFDKIDKLIICENKYGYARYFDIDEYNAIQQQIKELEW